MKSAKTQKRRSLLEQKGDDIIEKIRKRYQKTRVEEVQEELDPSVLNLFGLDIRFKYNEKQTEEEKKKLREVFKIRKSVHKKGLTSGNRHALPSQLKELISPKVVIPMH